MAVALLGRARVQLLPILLQVRDNGLAILANELFGKLASLFGFESVLADE